MNNSQFRRLVSDAGSPKDDGARSARPSALGTKKSSFMPMTPRTVKGTPDVDFARQVRERNEGLKPSKKFKTAPPKGVKYSAGYTDRAKARADAEAEDEESGKAGRIRALEEQMKLGQISEATFEALRDEITGGDVSSTHLVKGLDRRLLERVRRGEDVLGSGEAGESVAKPEDIDDELDKLEEKQFEAAKKEQTTKKGTMAPPPPMAGQKRSRDELMAELKTQRKAAAAAKTAPQFDSRWTKVGTESSKVKIDHKGREVIVTVDADGVVKKKVRKVAKADDAVSDAPSNMPDESRPVLGSDAFVPDLPNKEIVQEDSDGDIFEGVGAAYDPLGNNDDDQSSSDEEEDELLNEATSNERKETVPSKTPEATTETTNNDAAGDAPNVAPRNYFNEAPANATEPSEDRMAGMQELLKKAAKMDQSQTVDNNEDTEGDREAREARLKKRAQMLAQSDRDFEDMDMGFGSSRYDDEQEDGEDSKIKLSEWKDSGHGGNEDEDGGRKGSGDKKKRKPKKRKGDSNNMSDIMKVIEGRKSGSAK